jgi:hypothetical protein
MTILNNNMSGAPMGRPAHVVYETFLKNLVGVEWQFLADVLRYLYAV